MHKITWGIIVQLRDSEISVLNSGIVRYNSHLSHLDSGLT